MDKEEKEIELPSKGGKGGPKKRPSTASGTPTSAVAATPGAGARAPVKTIAAPPHTALFSAAATPAPTVPAPAVTPPATHTGLPQQVISFNNIISRSLDQKYLMLNWFDYVFVKLCCF